MSVLPASSGMGYRKLLNHICVMDMSGSYVGLYIYEICMMMNGDIKDFYIIHDFTGYS